MLYGSGWTLTSLNTIDPVGEEYFSLPPVFAMNYVQTSIPLSGSLLRGAHANNFVIDGVELPPGEWLAHRALSLDRRVQHGIVGTILARRKPCDPL